jgi:hypothetical protein
VSEVYLLLELTGDDYEECETVIGAFSTLESAKAQRPDETSVRANRYKRTEHLHTWHEEGDGRWRYDAKSGWRNGDVWIRRWEVQA